MKYLKTYENINEKPNYNVDDIVISIKDGIRAGIPPFLNQKTIFTSGKKYKVLRIYKSKYEYKVNVQDIISGKKYFNLEADLFQSEIEYNMNKYNL